MSTPLKDAIGQTIYSGDTVAHVTRCGSTTLIRARRVLSIREDGTLRLEPLTEGGVSGRVEPTNVVNTQL